MADFFRKIRKDSATFVRDRVAPRVREQFAASQKRVNGTAKDDSSATLASKQPKTHKAAWPEKATDSTSTPQPAKKNAGAAQPTVKDNSKSSVASTNLSKKNVEKQPAAPKKTSSAPQGGKPKPKASTTPNKSASKPKPQPSTTPTKGAGKPKPKASTTPTKGAGKPKPKAPVAPTQSKNAAGSVSAKTDAKTDAKSSSIKLTPRIPGAPKPPSAQTSAPKVPQEKPKKASKPQVHAATHMQRIRAQREARLKAAHSSKPSSAERRPLPKKSTSENPQPVVKEATTKTKQDNVSKKPRVQKTQPPQAKAKTAKPATTSAPAAKPTAAKPATTSAPAAKPKAAKPAAKPAAAAEPKAVKPATTSAPAAKPTAATSGGAGNTVAKTVTSTSRRPSENRLATPPREWRVPERTVAASEKKKPKNSAATNFRDRANANRGNNSAKPRTPANLKRRHIPGLDGVRGLAVIAVLLYHFWPALFPGGFMGVDMFFVLSGYLITFLLVREYRKTGRISLKQFWLRRARRILPAALVVIAICTALVSLFRGDIAVKVGYHALTSALFVSNWGQIAESGSYFSDNGLNIFTHYWSLSIEEQFYLVWPLLVMGILALGMRSKLLRRFTMQSGSANTTRTAGANQTDDKRAQITLLLYATIAIGLVSFIAMLVLYNPQEDPTRVYFGTDTHAFGLAVGAAIAFMVSRGSSFLTPRRSPTPGDSALATRFNPVLEAGAWIGFAAIVAMVLTVEDTAPFTYRGGLLIASLLTGWLVALSVRGQGSLVRVLSHPSLAWFGDRSFSLYLWHWPLFLMSKQFFTQTLEMQGDFANNIIVPCTALVATLGCTYFTFHYIENPFRLNGYRKTMMTLKGPRLAASTATASLVAVGIVVALATAPAQTNVEKQLQALAAQQKKATSSKNAAATGAAADPNASPMKSHRMPRGRAITAVGDSVLLASFDAMSKRFPGISIDADVSRHYTAGLTILQNLKAQKKLRNTVILGFGTNGQAFPGQLEQMLDVIGPDRTVILVAPYGPVNGISDAAQQVIEFSATHRNVYPAMWCQVAANNPNALYSDRVHPKPENANLYVRSITDALKLAASGEKKPRVTCPPM